jgi:RimJ/RimL family protein N-acetyltransferase
VDQKIIETDRLVIRPFSMDDLVPIHRILDQVFGDGNRIDDKAALAEQRSWLQWQMLNLEWLPKLHQPPFGDRAIVLKADGELIGSVGYVPCLDAFGQIPGLGGSSSSSGYNTTEFGLFWVIAPSHQRQGYATEAAQAMVEHAFKHLRLRRVVATTEYGNTASIGVMRKLGMTVMHNPLPDPPWLQVVGVLENPGEAS